MRWRLLCYHGVEGHECESFRAQLRFFQAAGWRFCSLSEGIARLERGERGRWVSVTFDDGDKTVFSVARPVLAALKIPACLYVVTDYVLRGSTYRDSPPRPAMSWEELHCWVGEGQEVGSHTHTHAPLNHCTAERVEHELRLSKKLLENALGVRVAHFSYPWGQYDEQTHALAVSLGLFQSFATIDRGHNRRATSPTLLRRDVVSPRWSIARLVLMLAWGQSPFYGIQRRVRKPCGYWDHHPEESWGSLVGAVRLGK